MFNLYSDCCPICCRKLVQDSNLMKIKCLNGCYSIQYHQSNIDIEIVSIFGHYINFWSDDIRFVILFKKYKVRRKIRYWKRKERYLVKILTTSEF
ncbi:hypothetical protein D3C87_76690 [compost metagenome]